MAVFTVTVNPYNNLPPSIVGDGTQTTSHATTLVYTRAMFTTNTVPPYEDPEGDAALDLKVISLPATGLLKYNSINVTLNQVISFTDIDAGLFTYVPDNTITGAHSTTFDFQISDEGSSTFVG